MDEDTLSVRVLVTPHQRKCQSYEDGYALKMHCSEAALGVERELDRVQAALVQPCGSFTLQSHPPYEKGWSMILTVSKFVYVDVV